LSVYYAPTPTSPSESNPNPEDDEDDDSSEEDSEDRDDDTVISESQMGDNMFDDLSAEGDAEEDADPDDDLPSSNPYGDSPYGDNRPPSASGAIRRIKVGPPQNTDTKGSNKGVSAQVSLQRVEHRLHKMSMGIAVEIVHSPATGRLEMVGADGTGSSAVTSSAAQASLDALKKKKIPLDEFDKLLGLQVKNMNLVQRIASGFLGPLMRMIRILVYATRVSFNVATWRDPILSWWAFLFLSVLFVILLFFPWRSFFFLVSLVFLGPQVSPSRRFPCLSHFTSSLTDLLWWRRTFLFGSI
jgi:hypothetical protein